MRWEPVPATTTGPNPAFPISASFHVKTTVQPWKSTVQSSRWVGCAEDKEVSRAWSRGCVRVKAVSSGLWEAEVQMIGLSVTERGLASNLALLSQQPIAGQEATLGFGSLVICLDPV